MADVVSDDGFTVDDIKIHSSEVVDKPLRQSPYERPVEIIVEAAAWNHMNRHACEDMRHEAGGIMLGGIYEHDGGLVVRITTAVAARDGVSTVTSIQFTYDAWSQMERERQDHAPNEKLLGWYHTHPGFSAFFSEDDKFLHEHFFSQEWHVALVIDPVLGEHRFYRWDGGRVQEVKDFLLRVGRDWPGPQLPANVVLATALRSAARQVGTSDSDAAVALVPVIEKLSRSVRVSGSPRGSGVLSLIAACGELPPNVVAEAQRRIESQRPPESPIRMTDLDRVANVMHADGLVAVAHGWLVEETVPRRLHLHALGEGQSFCNEMAIPAPARDIAVTDGGRVIILGTGSERLLQRIEPPLDRVRIAHRAGVRQQLAMQSVDISWGDRSQPVKVGKVLASSHDLYLLTKQEIWVLTGDGTRTSARFECTAVHGAAVCGWESFAEMSDWTCDASGNLYVLSAALKAVWSLDRLTQQWSRFAADEQLEEPVRMAAGLSTLSILDRGQPHAIVQYALADGRRIGRRPLEPEVQRLQMYNLFTDGYQRLYAITANDAYLVH